MLESGRRGLRVTRGSSEEVNEAGEDGKKRPATPR